MVTVMTVLRVPWFLESLGNFDAHGRAGTLLVRAKGIMPGTLWFIYLRLVFVYVSSYRCGLFTGRCMHDRLLVSDILISYWSLISFEISNFFIIILLLLHLLHFFLIPMFFLAIFLRFLLLVLLFDIDLSLTTLYKDVVFIIDFLIAWFFLLFWAFRRQFFLAIALFLWLLGIELEIILTV